MSNVVSLSMARAPPTKTEDDGDVEDFTERVLVSLVFDLSLLHESVERIRVQIHALQRHHGIEPPTDEPTG